MQLGILGLRHWHLRGLQHYSVRTVCLQQHLQLVQPWIYPLSFFGSMPGLQHRQLHQLFADQQQLYCLRSRLHS